MPDYKERAAIDGLIKKERSKLLVVLFQPGDRKLQLVNEISDGYRRRFSQESALQVVVGAYDSIR